MTCARHRCNANTFLRLHIALFTPHTPHFTLALHLNSSHQSSSHLIPCLPRCQLSSSWLFSCQVLSSNDVYYKSLQKLVPSTNLYYKACTRHVPVLLCTTKLAQNTSQYYFVLHSLRKALPSTSTTLNYKSCTKQLPVLLCTTKLAQTTSQYNFVLQRQNTPQYYFVLQGSHKTLPSTTLYYKACTKHSAVLLCTTKLAQTTSQYYFVLQSLYKALRSTTLYYKACTKDFPVLLCTTKLAQNTSQYYFVLHSLRKALPSTTLYYKSCTKQLPVLLCTTKLAQTTSQYYFVLQRQNTPQYYFVLQGSHKTLPSTTLYYKACTNYFPVLLCTTKLAQNTPQYYFVLQSLHKAFRSTTLYYKPCTKHSPVLLCTTKVAQRTSSTTLYYKACTKHSAVLLCTSVSLTTNLYKWLHTGEWVWEGGQSTYMGWFFVLKPPKLYGNAWKHSTMGHHCALIPLCENFCCCRLIFWHVVTFFTYCAQRS